MPSLSRRKSTLRYCFLWPPPRCQTTISPWLLRPPERFFGSSKAFSGSCLVMWLLSTTVINRREAVYGLKLFSPIAASYLLLNLVALAVAQAATCATGSLRTRSSFRLLRALRMLFSNRAGSLHSVRGGAFCRHNSRCAPRPLSP